MLDIKWIRENQDAFLEGMRRRAVKIDASKLLDLDKEYRAAQTELQALQKERNDISEQVGRIKKTGGNADDLLEKVSAIKDKMSSIDEQTTKLGAEIKDILDVLPNIPEDDVPVGGEDSAREERVWGEPTKFDFIPLSHDELGEKLGLMDFEQAAVMSGARFVLLKGKLAKLKRALGQFMIDLHTEKHGYTEMHVPLMVKPEALYGTGQLPKFDNGYITDQGLWLIPTAEVSLTNTVAGKILSEDELPIRITALTACFRSEAGAAGQDTKGMIRQHQFYKDELVSITDEESSREELERMTNCAEDVLKLLKLPYRVISLGSQDMSVTSRHTYDLEVWLPSQNRYREISSCSNCWDYQARRMNARYKKNGEKGTRLVHTLNGSGVAVGRALVAVMENYQQKDGSIKIPEVLLPYMGGITEIRA